MCAPSTASAAASASASASASTSTPTSKLTTRARRAATARAHRDARAPVMLTKRTVAVLVGAALVAGRRRDARAASADDEFAYTDVVVGTGAEPIAGVDVVKVNYKLSLADGATTADSAKFFVFGVGTGEVVKGFDIALCGDGGSVTPMRAGGVRKIRIPSRFAYGSRGAGCDKSGTSCAIPPDADLTFQIELLEVR